MAIIAAAIGGTLAAGGSLGAAAMSGGGAKVPTPRVSDPSLIIDPSLQAATWENLLSLGYLDPTALTTAGPLSRVMSQIMASPFWNTHRSQRLVTALQTAMKNWQAGRPLNEGFIGDDNKWLMFVEQAVGSAGYGSLEDLLTAESNYQTQIGDMIARVGPVAEETMLGRLQARQQLNTLMGNLPSGSAEAIAAEQARFKGILERDIGKLEEDVIRKANVGGYNPAGGLEQLAEARMDIDLEAMNRALALISGQQTLAGTEASMLSAYLTSPEAQATQLGGLQTGLAQGATSSTSGGYQTTDPWATAISNVGDILGETANTYALIKTLQNLNTPAPATTPTYYDVPYGYENLYAGYA